jgi:hypothetical protein
MYGSNLFKRELNQTASRIAVAVTMSVATPLALPTVAWSQTVTAGQTCVTAVVPGTADPSGDPSYVGSNAGAEVTAGSNQFSLACGGNAAALGQNSISMGFGAGVLPTGAVFDINDPTSPATASTADKATAVGVQSYVHSDGGSAFGYQAKASGVDGIAIGSGAIAGDTLDWNAGRGVGAVAVGAGSQAKMDGTIAIGQGAMAGADASSASTDIDGIAIGKQAEASKREAVAIGALAKAEHLNSIALGAGVATTADNQIAIGKTGQTYRLGGLATPDSKQYVVTVDQDGDLAFTEMTAGGGEPGLKVTGTTAGGPATAAVIGSFSNATALGSAAEAKASDALALGAGAKANFAGSIAIGKDAQTTAADQTVIGGSTYRLSGLKANTGSASTSGYFVTVDGQGNLGWAAVSPGGGSEPGIKLTGATAGGGASNAVVGNFSNASAIGSAAQAGADNATAVGAGSKANFAGAVALGQGSEVTGLNGIAIGKGVTAGANQTVIGGSTYQLSGLKANTGSASTSGYVVTVDGQGNLGWAAASPGGTSEPGLKLSGATANSAANPASVGAFTNAVALGSGAQVTGAGGIAIGAGVTAGAGETVIGGTKYRLSGLGAPSSGGQYFVTVDSSGNLGFSTVGGGGGGDPLGWKASGTGGGAASASTITSGKADALALGSGASVTETNGVALGAKSVAGAANSGMNYTLAGVTLTNQQAANGVVSVSGGGINRQITGVADGAVNSTSTDAVNGSQLFKVSDALDAKMTNIGDTLGSGILGTTVTMTDDGTLSTSKFTVGTAQYSTVQDAFTGINTAITNISNGGSVGVSLRDANGGTSLAPATTSGKFASAVGSGATATGDNTLAIGGGSKATAAGATAVGTNAQATHAGSTAIGAGATSERENQMVYGTGTSTHTMKGTTSTASQGLVSKTDNYIMVTNTNGDVAAYRASELNLASQSDLTNIRKDVNRAFKQIDENTQGIAIAIAMTGALTLPVNHNFGISANWGNYEGKNAFSSTAAFRLSEHLIASGALGVGLDTGSVGTRVGVQMTW